ncbi:TPA: hypothetical protein ACHTQK_005049, partial [Escherichia coli]
MTPGIIKPSGSFKTQMHFGTSFNALFIRKLGEQTARQRQIIDLLDNEAGLTEQERKLLHVLATAEKNDLQAQENERKQTIQKRIEG